MEKERGGRSAAWLFICRKPFHRHDLSFGNRKYVLTIRLVPCQDQHILGTEAVASSVNAARMRNAVGVFVFGGLQHHV